MSGAISTRLATGADVDAILGLVRASLGEGTIPRSAEYWRWKHVANPFGESPCLLAEADGQLVGLRAFMRWRWQSSATSVPAVRAVDTATHPDWQGRGIFKRLTLALVEQMEAEGVGFVFNTPNEQSRPGYLKMGWTSLGKTDLWIRPLRPLRLLRSLAARGRTGPDPEEQEAGESEFAPASALLADSDLDRFLSSLPDDDTRLVTRPTREYLGWRYVAVPGFRYHAVWTFDGDAQAAVIFRMKRQGRLRELRVCDLLARRGSASRAAASRLLREIARRSGADYATVMAASRTPERTPLPRARFLPVPRIGPIFTVRQLTPSASPVDSTVMANWRPSIGALELF